MTPWVVLLLCLAGALGIWYAWATYGIQWAHHHVQRIAPEGDRNNTLAALSQTGEAFGGGNALFAAIAGGLVLWAGWLQATALKEARAAYQRQQFESTFFELLKLTRELLERISVTPTPVYLTTRLSTNTSAGATPQTPITGAAALDAHANAVVGQVKEQFEAAATPTDAARLLVQAYRSLYRTHRSAFGPYFRVLFQTFKHIAESGLPLEDRVRFANIARGQVSDAAVLLIALNGLTPIGFKFIRFVEEFGLLEHLHRGYLARCKTALLEGYHERAFLGSDERKRHPMTPGTKQPHDYFIRELQEPIAAGGQPADPDLYD